MFAEVPFLSPRIYAKSLTSDCADMDMALDNIVPETLDWLHTDGGPE